MNSGEEGGRPQWEGRQGRYARQPWQQQQAPAFTAGVGRTAKRWAFVTWISSVKPRGAIGGLKNIYYALVKRMPKVWMGFLIQSIHKIYRL
jgi:hypothetical protein